MAKRKGEFYRLGYEYGAERTTEEDRLSYFYERNIFLQLQIPGRREGTEDSFAKGYTDRVKQDLLGGVR